MANFLLNAWRIEPLFLGSFVTIGVAYLAKAERTMRGALLFACGMVVWLAAEISPLDTLGSSYLLSAHMLQHLVLSQIAPPLLILGSVGVLAGGKEKHIASMLAVRPALAWLIGIGALWFWHAPPVYGAVATNATLRSIQHLTVLLAGLVFWWPVFGPGASARRGVLATIFYLASACLATTVLGMLLTFAPSVIYQGYLAGGGDYRVRFLCLRLGLTPQVDQQLAGLLMWVPCCLLYLSTISFSMVRWYSAPDHVTATN